MISNAVRIFVSSLTSKFKQNHFYLELIFVFD